MRSAVEPFDGIVSDGASKSATKFGVGVVGTGFGRKAIMQPFASLSADKSDAGDVVTLYSWNTDKKDFVAGPFIDIG